MPLATQPRLFAYCEDERYPTYTTRHEKWFIQHLFLAEYVRLSYQTGSGLDDSVKLNCYEFSRLFTLPERTCLRLLKDYGLLGTSHILVVRQTLKYRYFGSMIIPSTLPFQLLPRAQAVDELLRYRHERLRQRSAFLARSVKPTCV